MEQGRSIASSQWLTAFLFLTAALSSTILLKVGPVQYLEILYFVELIVLLAIFSKNGYKLQWFRPYLRIAIYYLLFSLIGLILSICALRYDFYMPDGLGILGYPVIITLSRIVELLASVSIMLYLAEKFREDQNKTAFTMRAYFGVGVLSAVFSILSYPLSLAGVIDLGAYGDPPRMRGFYNEGGPYGLYLISLFVVGIALHRQGWITKKFLVFGLIIVSIAFFGSASKAAFCAVIFMLLINGLLAKSLFKRVALIGVIVLFLVTVYQVIDLAAALRVYQRGSQAYEWLSHQHAKDTSFVYGRVAGAFIVPRMVEAHPLVGIGWGNYSLVRNAPEYRGAAAFARLSDEPSLGILGMAGELGLPLVFFLGICLILPFIYLRRLKSPLYITNLALLQPMVHLFGGQLNLTYPWVVTAFALGMGYSLTKASEPRDLTVPFS